MCDFDKIKKFIDAAFHNDTYGTAPYAKHLNDCVQLLDSLGVTDNDLRCAMYSHDLVEDHIDQYIEFREVASKPVWILVAKLSRSPCVTYDEYITNMLEDNNKAVMLLKLVDVCCNREACQLDNQNSLLKRYVNTEAKLKLHFYYKFGVKYNPDTRLMLQDIVNQVKHN